MTLFQDVFSHLTPAELDDTASRAFDALQEKNRLISVEGFDEDGVIAAGDYDIDLTVEMIRIMKTLSPAQ